jgi:hypothetical protein
MDLRRGVWPLGAPAKGPSHNRTGARWRADFGFGLVNVQYARNAAGIANAVNAGFAGDSSEKPGIFWTGVLVH